MRILERHSLEDIVNWGECSLSGAQSCPVNILVQTEDQDLEKPGRFKLSRGQLSSANRDLAGYREWAHGRSETRDNMQTRAAPRLRWPSQAILQCPVICLSIRSLCSKFPFCFKTVLRLKTTDPTHTTEIHQREEGERMKLQKFYSQRSHWTPCEVAEDLPVTEEVVLVLFLLFRGVLIQYYPKRKRW